MVRVLLLSVAVVVFFGCKDKVEIKQVEIKQIEIKQMGWLIENIHSTYWDGYESLNPYASCFYRFWIYLEGERIEEDDIELASVTAQVGDGLTWSWDLSDTPGFFDEENQIVDGWTAGLWYYGDSPDSLPIGKVVGIIKLKNGESTSYTLDVPAPGSESTDGYRWVYTEDYSGSYFSSHVPMISRADVLGGKQHTVELEMTFTVDDSRVAYAWVEFYNSEGLWVGTSRVFDFGPGGDFNNDGTLNVVTVIEKDITEWEEGYEFYDIERFVIGLSDGFQYPRNYDCISRSEKNVFDTPNEIDGGVEGAEEMDQVADAGI